MGQTAARGGRCGAGVALPSRPPARPLMRPWRTLSRRTVLSRPPWMEVAEERIALPDGREIDGFLAVTTRDFVVVAAITSDGRFVLIRSYKHGPRAISLACAAGYVEAGEEPVAAAKRELREETGHESADWSALGSYVVDGNYRVATAFAYLARDARRVAEPASGDLEEMEVVTLPLASVDDLLARGEIPQLSSAATLALAMAALRRGASPLR